MKIEEKIAQGVREAVKALYGADIDIKSAMPGATRKEFEGDYTVVVFPFLRASKQKPEATAQAIGEWLVRNVDVVTGFNVVKGFLNLTVDAALRRTELLEQAADENFGFTAATADSPLVMVEYSSPNTNKPLHLGHVRNNLLGYSLSKILEAAGNRVVKTNIVNDRGIHICKSMLAWQKWGDGCTPESTGKKGDHLIGDFYVLFDKHYKAEVADLMAQGMTEDEAKNEAPLMREAREMLVRWEQNDPEVRRLWQTMNGWVYEGFDETYKRLGVGFDKIYYESETYLEGKELVLKGLEEGKMYRR